MPPAQDPPRTARPIPRPRRRGPKAPFVIGEMEVMPGKAATGEIEIPRLVTGTRVSLPLRILHGRNPGPTMFVSSAIHGDEILGVEIIRRVADSVSPRTLHGTVVFVPIVNVHGFLTGDRYLPDRRDLNRSFPGSSRGSLAARIADAFLREVVTRCDVGIDLHTGSDHRTNLPQIRCDLDDDFTRELADAFSAPITLGSTLRKGSLRGEASKVGATILLYEAGESLRFDHDGIEVGVGGILRVLHSMEMTPTMQPPAPTRLISVDHHPAQPLTGTRSSWVRARRSGIGLFQVGLGDLVTKGQQLGLIHDSLGKRLSRITAPFAGLVIGHTQHPLVHQGSALFHVAEITAPAQPQRSPDQPPAASSDATSPPAD